MLLSLVYFAVRRLLSLLARGSQGDDVAREIEILVLRHQLRVLGRGRRVPLRRRDKVVLAAASRLPGRERWHSFPISAQTLLRWYRELVRRKWTYRRRRRVGRPRMGGEKATLILRLAKEDPRWGYTEGVRVIRTPIRSPEANAFAERFVKTVRHECLDYLLIFGERHLRWALREYLRHYDEERPHRGLSLETSEPGGARFRAGVVVRVDRLGRLIHEYQRAAA